MKHLVRLLFILILCLGVFGMGVLAQDAEPEVTPEANTETNSNMEANDMDMMENSVVDIINADFEGAASFVRFLHFVPGDMAVDVYIDGELSDTQGLSYMDSGNWLVVPAGNHSIGVTGAGDTVDNAFWVGDVNLPQNEPIIVAVVANAGTDTTSVLVVHDDYGEVLPSVGTINFVNAMSDDTTVNLLRDDVVFIAGVAAPQGTLLDTSNTIPVDADTYTFSLTYSGTDEVANGATVDLKVRDEDNYLLVATGTHDNPHLKVYETPQAQVNVMRGEVEAPGTVIDVLRAHGYDDVVTAIEDAGLTDTLNGDSFYTLFIPADYLMDELAQTEDVANVLKNHIVEGDYRSSDFLLTEDGTVTTLYGDTVAFGVNGDNLVVGDMHVLDTNWVATNGIIHLIDGILLPDTDE